jgi:hypothetical protein
LGSAATKINLNSEDRRPRIAREFIPLQDKINKEFGSTAYKSEALSTRIKIKEKGWAHSAPERSAVRPLDRAGAQRYKRLLIKNIVLQLLHVPNLSKQLGLEKESYNLLDNCKLYLLGQFSHCFSQRGFNDLLRAKLSCGRMMWLHALPLPSASCLSFTVFMSVAGLAYVVEPNHATGRKLGYL